MWSLGQSCHPQFQTDGDCYRGGTNAILKAGQAMTMDTTADGKITLSPKRKYVLSDLIAQCDRKAPAPADMALWDAARPVGQEVL